jgi:hypothetical protein
MVSDLGEWQRSRHLPSSYIAANVVINGIIISVIFFCRYGIDECMNPAKISYIVGVKYYEDERYWL